VNDVSDRPRILDMRFGAWNKIGFHKWPCHKSQIQVTVNSSEISDEKAVGRELRKWTGFFIQKRTLLAIKRVAFISDGMSYIILRGSWVNIVVLNVHTPKEDKIHYVKESFCEELESVFN
jgi:hypothetical protein